MLFPSQYLTSTLQYVISLAVPNQFAPCFWCHAVYFSNIVCQNFVHYCSTSAISLTCFINSLQFITQRTNTGGGLWIFYLRGFPSMESHLFHLLSNLIGYVIPFLFRRYCVVFCVLSAFWCILSLAIHFRSNFVFLLRPTF